MNDYLTPEQKRRILSVSEFHFPGSTVYLLTPPKRGHYIKGETIQIAIDLGARVPFSELERAKISFRYIELPFRVQIDDLRCFSSEVRDDIFKNGIVLKRTITPAAAPSMLPLANSRRRRGYVTHAE